MLVRVCPLAQRRPQIPAPAAAGKFSLFDGAKLKREASENRCCGVGSGPQSLVGVCPLARTMPRIREPARTAETPEKKIAENAWTAVVSLKLSLESAFRVGGGRPIIFKSLELSSNRVSAFWNP